MNEVQLLKVKMSLLNSKQHKRGKVYRGANFTAYNRSNLGSIPSNVENVIFERPIEDFPQGFLKKSQRFANYIPTVKVSFSNKDNESYQLKYSKSYQNLSNIKYLNANRVNHFGSENRFEQPELIRSKYSPGPGEYSPIEKIDKSFRYQSIFAERKGHPLPQKEVIKPQSQQPSERYYDKEKEYDKERDKESPSKDKKSVSVSASVFFAKAPRFNYKDRDDDEDISGPGFFDYGSTFDIKQKGQLSSFFKGSVRQEDPLKSQFITALREGCGNSNSNSNGFNSSATVSVFNSQRRHTMLKPIKSYNQRSKPFQEIKEEKLNELKNIKEERGPNYYLEQKIKFQQVINSRCKGTLSTNNNSNGSINSYRTVFKTNKLRRAKCDIMSNSNNNNKPKHVPGPCYYDPMDIRTKKYFHLPDPRIWI